VISRLPIRLRLTLVFAVVMAVALVIVGLVLSFGLGRQLDTAIDQGLRARAADVSSLVAGAPEDLDRRPGLLTARGESFAQVIDPTGRVLDTTRPVRSRPLLDRAQVRLALGRRLMLQEGPRPGLRFPLRLLAVPAIAGGRPVVVVVGTPLVERRRAVHEVGLLFLAGGPFLLVLASAACYLVARAALRPVESMRGRAAEISGTEPEARLPVPAARDEIRRLGETLNEMLARVDEALERERAFAADASHELRTPLAIVRAELELAARPGRRPAEIHEALASVGEEVDRLARLADDLLVMARADRNRLVAAREELEADELLHSAAARAQARADAEGRRLEVRSSAHLTLLADRMRLEQALGNLVDNALSHGTGDVTLRAQGGDGGPVELWVEDEGSFPPDLIPTAFDRFTRAPGARGTGGAGLGLAIVRAIALAHGGEAVAENRPEGGSRVGIRVPG